MHLTSDACAGQRTLRSLPNKSAFWLTDEASSNPDSEILAAVRPGLATTGGPMFLISSPYARKGELWRIYQKHYGAGGDPLILVAQADSRAMNATLPQSVIDRAFERDPASAAAEYGAEFRRDIEGFVAREAVLACVSPAAFERPKEHYKVYAAFTDPSGGSSDSFTLAIGHRDLSRKVVVIDAVREVRPPFSPEGVCSEFATLLKCYGVSRVTGDRYAGEWPREQFGKFGIKYEPCGKAKSDLYVDLLPLLNSRRIELLDNARLISQLCDLERRTARSGKDSIDHSPGSHDDVANACAGVAAALISKYGNYDTTYRAFQPGFVDEDLDPSKPQPAPADAKLNSLYGAIDAAFRNGAFR